MRSHCCPTCTAGSTAPGCGPDPWCSSVGERGGASEGAATFHSMTSDVPTFDLALSPVARQLAVAYLHDVDLDNRQTLTVGDWVRVRDEESVPLRLRDTELTFRNKPASLAAPT